MEVRHWVIQDKSHENVEKEKISTMWTGTKAGYYCRIINNFPRINKISLLIFDVANGSCSSSEDNLLHNANSRLHIGACMQCNLDITSWEIWTNPSIKSYDVPMPCCRVKPPTVATVNPANCFVISGRPARES